MCNLCNSCIGTLLDRSGPHFKPKTRINMRKLTFFAGLLCILTSATRDNEPAPAHYIGEKFGGGIVFHVFDDGKHGLIAATDNQSEGAAWSNGVNKEAGTSESFMEQGAKNTELIITAQASDNPAGKYAAKICADYVVKADGQVYDDWYLPSKHELNLLYQVNEKVGGFDERYFWTSNERNIEEAWIQSFYDGRFLNVRKSDGNWVRAIRAF